MKAFLYRVCAIFFSHFVLYPDYRISFFIPLAFRFADYKGFLGNYEGDVRDHFFHCQAGVSVGSVLVDGAISACPSIRADYHQGNIYKDDFMEVWNNKYQPYRDREWMRKGECADCEFFRYCKGNGMHLRDGKGDLLFCHYKRLQTL